MPSVVQLIRSDSLAETSYAYAATAPANARLVFLAGACPLHDDGTTAAVGNVAGQAAACLALDTLEVDPEVVADTAGILFKQREDVAALTRDFAAELLKPEPADA